jgi:hypothetical protein
MDAKLKPGNHFAELFPASVGSWQKKERVGEIGHQGFAFVHGGNDVKMRERRMSDFPFDKRLRDYTNGLTSGGENRISEDAHQADTAAAENECDAGGRQCAAELAGGFGIDGIRAGAGAAEHAEPLDFAERGMHCAGEIPFVVDHD